MFASVHSGAPRGCLVHSVSRGYTPAGQAAVAFIRVRVCSLGNANGSLGSFGFMWVYLGAPMCLPVYSGSRGFTGARLVVIWVCLGSLVRAYVSSGSFGFTWVDSFAPKVRPVHSDSRGFTGALLMVVGFIRLRVGSLGRS